MSELSPRYGEHVGLEHRKQFGQFFTPEPIARWMVRWVLEGGARRVYDPAFGLGAFYRAAREIAGDVAFEGSEVDPVILGVWRARGEGNGLVVRQEDYLRAWGRQWPAIVCNPPYRRFQKFLGREEVFAAFEERLGVRLSGYTNIASAFLLKSISELCDGGRLAYILPLEFLNTGYGTVVKRQMLARGQLHAIIRLDCEKAAFPDVVTSVGILLFEKRAPRFPTRFYVVSRLEALDGVLDTAPVNSVAPEELRPGEKWLRHFGTGAPRLRSTHLVPLSTYGTFSRGIATGANAFFILRPSQVAALGLAPGEVVPTIARSAQIRGPVFTETEFRRLAAGDAPIYLLRAGDHPSAPAARYIRRGEAHGYHTRYLTRMRVPWYRLEKRRPAPILFGAFSRDGYKVIRNHTRALNLTCYHGFQPAGPGARYVERIFLYLLSWVGRETVALNVRQYGAALGKYEPNDLNQALVPSVEWMERLDEEQAAAEAEHAARHGHLSSEMEALFQTLIDS
ncbi:MAG TPA: N-6 DNA methylase [Armatimonadetes bacterium]|jgi:adenine-specific DNA-methyltransferase|nr:N-6 DNA methylase [Armatimonadota bacterium]